MRGGTRDDPDRRGAAERDREQRARRLERCRAGVRDDGDHQLQLVADDRHAQHELCVGVVVERDDPRGERVGGRRRVGAQQPADVGEPGLEVRLVAGDRRQPRPQRARVVGDVIERQRRQNAVESQRAEQVIGDAIDARDVAERVLDQRLDGAHEVAPQMR